jgi:hypothetical protein
VQEVLLLAAERALVMLTHFSSERLLLTWENKATGTKLEEYYARCGGSCRSCAQHRGHRLRLGHYSARPSV